jgi:DNA polymerase-3 subunit epsilon|tara:strand:+ start:106 stop:690 length:585 start_codon:yes stop_codon:yes gene_type:complete
MQNNNIYLFFDTETTGLPQDWKAPVSDTNNWPRIVQIAWVLSSQDDGQLESKDFIIKPEGFTIPKESSDVHGISTEQAYEEGKDLLDVLTEFDKDLRNSTRLVAHNISFDEKVLGAEFIRKGIENDFFEKRRLCTMQKSTDYCKLPGRYGYKWPTLSELHITLFGKDFEDAHNAMGDVIATENCFWKLRDLGIV